MVSVESRVDFGLSLVLNDIVEKFRVVFCDNEIASFISKLDNVARAKINNQVKILVEIV